MKKLTISENNEVFENLTVVCMTVFVSFVCEINIQNLLYLSLKNLSIICMQVAKGGIIHFLLCFGSNYLKSKHFFSTNTYSCIAPRSLSCAQGRICKSSKRGRAILVGMQKRCVFLFYFYDNINNQFLRLLISIENTNI